MNCCASKKDQFFHAINLNQFHEQCLSNNQAICVVENVENAHHTFDSTVLLIYEQLAYQLKLLKNSKHFSFINFDYEIPVHASYCFLQLFILFVVIFVLAKCFGLNVVKCVNRKKQKFVPISDVKVLKKDENKNEVATSNQTKSKNIQNDKTKSSDWQSHPIDGETSECEGFVKEIWPRKKDSVIQNKIDNRKRKKLISLKRKCNSAGPILLKLSDDGDDGSAEAIVDKELSENIPNSSALKLATNENEKKKSEKSTEQSITITSYFYMCVITNHLILFRCSSLFLDFNICFFLFP